MTLWVVRGGQQGEREALDLGQGIAVIHSKATGLTKASNANGLRAHIRNAHPAMRE